MEDLKVSYGKLEESAKNLKTVQSELQNIGGHQSDIKGALGSGDIAHAMDDFANNWDYHRNKLLDKVTGLLEATKKTVEAFGDVDSKLTKSLSSDKK
jgi:hypothetical protein